MQLAVSNQPSPVLTQTIDIESGGWKSRCTQLAHVNVACVTACMQGIDALGVEMDYRADLDFDSMERPVPMKKLVATEFKATFKNPDKLSVTNNRRTYNHSFTLTDHLVCWDMKWSQDHQVSTAA